MYKGGGSFAGSVAGNEQTTTRGNSRSREPHLRRRPFMRSLPTNGYSAGKGLYCINRSSIRRGPIDRVEHYGVNTMRA